MHFYQWNIADYRKDTQHLTPIEHYIYRELMDWYYLDEQPIPNKTQWVMRRLRLVSENEPDLLNVLDEFFFLEDETWKHGRIEDEIRKYRERVLTAQANGRKGGRPKKPKKTQSVNLANQKEPRQKLTNNHKPISINRGFTPPTLQEVADYCTYRGNSVSPQRFLDHYETNGWMRGKTKIKDWKACVRTWESNERGNGASEESCL